MNNLKYINNNTTKYVAYVKSQASLNVYQRHTKYTTYIIYKKKIVSNEILVRKTK